MFSYYLPYVRFSFYIYNVLFLPTYLRLCRVFYLPYCLPAYMLINSLRFQTPFFPVVYLNF